MTKKPLLLPFVFCGMLLSSAQMMFASPLKGVPTGPGQEPLDAARDRLVSERTQATQRALTAVLSKDAEGKHLELVMN